ncbi:efflux transporter outer membrane subunit [Hydrogenophaga sp. OTU3427]|uniref:efflux transporter outer membrane subunit n=1 Tax=Hydrogenophaga sp. OTU3427 TaxID=3043856 RepID=UPI00313A8807
MLARTFPLWLGCLLVGCSLPQRPDPAPAVALPLQWQAPPLPHAGSTEHLGQWWSRFNDPVLSRWIARAQAASPSVASARARVFVARATSLGVAADTGPQAVLVGRASRGQTDPLQPLGSLLSAGAEVSWALDLWGEAGARRDSAQAQQDSASAGWHDARVLVAADTARLYFAQRLCVVLLGVAAADRDSRAATAAATTVAEQAGLTAPAVAALARASRADAAGRHGQQAQACERQIKALSALTGLAEPELRAELRQAPDLSAWLVSDEADRALSVGALPVEIIRQRPDVYRAQRELVAASAQVGVAQAALLPSLSLSGNLFLNRFSGAGAEVGFETWSIGPLTLRLPLLGRERLDAGVASARAQYEAASKAYAATLRQAVSEVEQALVSLSALGQRRIDAQAAAQGYGQSFVATEARHRAGLASLNELEDARRLQLNAQNAMLALEQERVATWIDLYVALGGGFDPMASAQEALKDKP